MSKKNSNKRLIGEPFETNKPGSYFSRLYKDMHESEAWQDLTLTQRGLYHDMKQYWRPNIDHGVPLQDDNRDRINYTETHMNKAHITRTSFVTNANALLQHGFISVKRYGNRQANEYGLSDRWKEWKKTAPFELSASELLPVPPSKSKLQGEESDSENCGKRGK